jgi:hypothetical protein
VREVIVLLDVIEVHGLGNSQLLVEVGEITLEVWVIDDPAQTAFEMDVVDDVEANEGAKQSPVALHDSVSKQVPPGR